MKKGDLASIKKNAKYVGQYIRWSEPCTGFDTLEAGTKLIHTSDRKLSGFTEKETCFFTDDRGTGHCYIITLKKDIEVEYFGSEEVRFDIDDSNIEIQYVGFRGYNNDYHYVDKTMKIEIT